MLLRHRACVAVAPFNGPSNERRTFMIISVRLQPCAPSALPLLILAIGLIPARPAVAQIDAPNLQLNLRGTAKGRPPNTFESRFVGPTADCFTTSLRDPSDDKTIGTATDCLENPIPDGVPDNLLVIATKQRSEATLHSGGV